MMSGVGTILDVKGAKRIDLHLKFSSFFLPSQIEKKDVLLFEFYPQICGL